MKKTKEKRPLPPDVLRVSFLRIRVTTILRHLLILVQAIDKSLCFFILAGEKFLCTTPRHVETNTSVAVVLRGPFDFGMDTIRELRVV